MKNSKTRTLIILCAVLILAILAFVIIRCCVSESEDDGAEPDDYTLVFNGDSATLTKMSYPCDNNGDGVPEQLSFTRVEDEKWVWDDKPDLRLSFTLVDDLAFGAVTISASRTLTDVTADELEKYGLSSPSGYLAFTDGNGSIKLWLGIYNKAMDAYYSYAEGAPETVYLLHGSAVTGFNATVKDLIEYDLLPNPDPSVLISVSFKKGGNTRELKYYPSGNAEDYSTIFNWYVSENGGEYFALDETTAGNLTTELSSLAFYNCASYEKDFQSTCGLDSPAEMEIKYLDNGAEVSRRILFGDIVSGKNYYATVPDSDITYLFSGTVINALFDDKFESLLSRRVFAPDWSRISSVAVTSGQLRAEIGIHTSTDENGKAQISYTLNGAPAEYAAVIPIFDKLSGIKDAKNSVADEIPSDTDVNHLMEFTFTFTDGSVRTLTFTEWNGEYKRVIFNGRDTLLVRADEYQNLSSEIEKLCN